MFHLSKTPIVLRFETCGISGAEYLPTVLDFELPLSVCQHSTFRRASREKTTRMARPQARQRYNSKARQSTLGGSSHKKRRRSKPEHTRQDGEGDLFEGVENGEAEDNEGEDNFVQEPQSESRMEVSSSCAKSLHCQYRPTNRRTQTMRKELAPEGEASMSSKKRKRLDAYIAKKLKQEEMHESLRIIAANALATPSAPQSSASATNALSNLEIKSTKTLGQFPFNPLSAQELADRKEDLVVRKAMVGAPIGRKNGRRARAGAYDNVNMEGHESEEEGDEDIADEEEAPEEDERTIKKRKKAERNGIVMDVGSGVPVSASKKAKKTQTTSSKSTVKVRALADAPSNLAHFYSF